MLPLLVLGAVIAALAVAYGSWRLGDALAGVDQAVPPNPVEAFIDLARHRLVWPMTATIIAAVIGLVVVALVVVVAARRGRRSRIDAAAARMAAPRRGDLRAARKEAQRLRPGTPLSRPDDYGIEVGRTVIGDHPVRMSWEDVGVVIAGPRMGKTKSVGIRAVCAAPGAVAATSNKGDLHDHTRGVREALGTVWNSDLQGVTDTPGAQWWWNPLAGITSPAPARRLAGHFVSASTDESARVDAYFDGGARELLALHLLAAAVGGGDMLHTLAWLSDDDSPVPVKILTDAGQPAAADAIRRAQKLNPRQKDGLFDMARRYLTVLTEPAYAQSVTPPRRRVFDGDDGALATAGLTHTLPEFDPVAFVSSTDTLYAHSKEGPDSAAALTTALMGCVLDAAQAAARHSPGRRLPTPLVAVLDEAANICKLAELPQQYSHFGSQGIVVLTFLQSPAQAVGVWGQTQFDALRSAANMHLFGGNVDDDDYKESISRQIGDYDVSRWSASSGRGPGGGGRSQSWSSEAILPLSDLGGEVTKDRGIVMTSGRPPVVVRKVFWQDSPYAEEIRASLAVYDPGAAGAGPDGAVSA